MPSIVFKGTEFEISRSDSYSLPAGVSELRADFENVRIKYRFVFDRNLDREAKADFEDGHIVYTLTNFNNSLGTAFDSQVGHVDGLRVHMACVAHAIGEGESGGWPLSITISFFKEVAR